MGCSIDADKQGPGYLENFASSAVGWAANNQCSGVYWCLQLLIPNYEYIVYGFLKTFFRRTTISSYMINFTTAKLQNRQELSSVKIHHFNKEEHEKFCDFFGRLTTDRSNEKNWKIPGLRCELYRWQAYAVWHIVNRCLSNKNGCYLGDVPGMGQVSSMF